MLAVKNRLERIERVRRRVLRGRRLVLCLVAALGSLVAIMLCDRMLVLPPAVRLAFLIFWITGLGLGLRCCLPAKTTSRQPLAITRLIEARFPQWGGRLASAVEFLDGSPPARRGRSARLQQALLERVARDSARQDWERLIEWPSGVRALGLLAGMTAGVAVLAHNFPTAAVRGLYRTLDPCGGHAWSIIEDRTPSRLASGQPLQLHVVVRGAAPAAAEMVIVEGAAERRLILPITGSSPSDEAVVTASLEALPPFSYRLRVLDGVVERRILRAEPPQFLEAETVIHIDYPRHASMPSQSVHGVLPLRVVRGTKLMVRTATNSAVQRAWYGIHAIRNEESGRESSVEGRGALGESQRHCSYEIDTAALPSGLSLLALHAEDVERLRTSIRLPLHVEEDPSPRIRIESWPIPTVHLYGGEAMLSATAVIADEQYGLASACVVWTREADELSPAAALSRDAAGLVAIAPVPPALPWGFLVFRPCWEYFDLERSHRVAQLAARVANPTFVGWDYHALRMWRHDLGRVPIPLVAGEVLSVSILAVDNHPVTPGRTWSSPLGLRVVDPQMRDRERLHLVAGVRDRWRDAEQRRRELLMLWGRAASDLQSSHRGDLERAEAMGAFMGAVDALAEVVGAAKEGLAKQAADLVIELRQGPLGMSDQRLAALAPGLQKLRLESVEPMRLLSRRLLEELLAGRTPAAGDLQRIAAGLASLQSQLDWGGAALDDLVGYMGVRVQLDSLHARQAHLRQVVLEASRRGEASPSTVEDLAAAQARLLAEWREIALALPRLGIDHEGDVAVHMHAAWKLLAQGHSSSCLPVLSSVLDSLRELRLDLQAAWLAEALRRDDAVMRLGEQIRELLKHGAIAPADLQPLVEAACLREEPEAASLVQRALRLASSNPADDSHVRGLLRLAMDQVEHRFEQRAAETTLMRRQALLLSLDTISSELHQLALEVHRSLEPRHADGFGPRGLIISLQHYRQRGESLGQRLARLQRRSQDRPLAWAAFTRCRSHLELATRDLRRHHATMLERTAAGEMMQHDERELPCLAPNLDMAVRMLFDLAEALREEGMRSEPSGPELQVMIQGRPIEMGAPPRAGVDSSPLLSGDRLPPLARRSLLRVPLDQFLPKFQDECERYFRAIGDAPAISGQR